LNAAIIPPMPRQPRFPFLSLLLAGVLGLFTQTVIAADPTAATEERQRWDRFQPEFDAFDAADRASPPVPGEILFVGSSVFRRWKDVAAQMDPLPVRNRAFGGSRTGDQLARFDRLIPAYRPAVIVYYCGSNDLKAGIPAETVFARFREFSERVAQVLPEAHLLFVSSTRSPDRSAKFAEVDRYNSLVQGYCSATARRHFVDINPALVDAAGVPLPGVYGADNLHPEARGYEIIATILKPALIEVWAVAKRN
jgi:lysophospholipase L1-like esterase